MHIRIDVPQSKGDTMKAISDHDAWRRSVAATLMLVLGNGMGVSVHAQDDADQVAGEPSGGLGQIIVTAQRREENLMEVPISVAAFSAESLETRGVVDTDSLSEVTPSIQFTSSGPAGNFFIRGVGNTNSGVGEEGTNAFYVDGVYLPDLFQSVLKFNNIERIEVLRGPQGTLFGRNSTGGLVNIITREPGDEFVGEFKLGAAKYDTYSQQAYVAGPLTDTLSADIAFTNTDQGEGWGNNLLTGAEVGKTDDWGVRTKFVWTPSDSLKLTFAADYAELDENASTDWYIAPGTWGLAGGIFLVPPLTPPPYTPPASPSPGDNFDTTSNDQGFTDLDTRGANLTLEFDLGRATLTSITGARKLNEEARIDVDGGPSPIYTIYLQSTESTSYQQEFRLASNDSGPLNWQTGLFYLHIKTESEPTITDGLAVLGGSGGAISRVDDYVTQETDSYSAFGEVTYEFETGTDVTVGLRYTRDERDLTGRQIGHLTAVPGMTTPTVTRDDSQTDEEMTWRLALQQDITDNANVYVSYNRGFKSGLYALSGAPWDYVEPQTIDAYEIGTKSTWFDNRLRVNLAAFHYEIDDYQVRLVKGFTQRLGNAAEVENDGFEAEFEALVYERLNLFGSITLLDAEFKKYPNCPALVANPPIVGGSADIVVDASGNETPLAPDFAYSIGASYSWPLSQGEMRFTTMYSYNDGYFFDANEDQEQPSYGLLNASLNFQSDQGWGVEVWGRNLGNQTYYRSKLPSQLAILAVREAPRTYGVDFTYKF